MTVAAARRRRVVPVVVAGVVLLIAVSVVRALLGALGALGMSPAHHVDVTAALTLSGDTVHLRAELHGTGLTGMDVRPDLADTDNGYALNSTEHTTGRPLVYRNLRSTVASDGRSATIEYDVAGTVVYPVPLSPRLTADRLDVTVTGGSVASCLTQYSTTNGTPRLRPCAPGSGPSFTLRSSDNPLERVRLVLT